MKKVLFVCTGNICRSPMAEGIFNHQMLTGKAAPAYQAASAGIYALDGEVASWYAVQALQKMDIDISGHRARGVSSEIMEEAFLIITMTRAHKTELIGRYAQHQEKMYTFYEFCEEATEKDVEDPYGFPLETYIACSRELEAGMAKLMDKL